MVESLQFFVYNGEEGELYVLPKLWNGKSDLNFCPNCGVDLKEVRRKMEESHTADEIRFCRSIHRRVFLQTAATNNMCVICGQNPPKKNLRMEAYAKSCLTFSRLYKPKNCAQVLRSSKIVLHAPNQLGTIFQATRRIDDEIFVSMINIKFCISNNATTISLIQILWDITYWKELKQPQRKAGVGRAIVGGALFGGAGAVVGAATRKTNRFSHN